MKTARLVIGIISIVLFAFITFQSCFAGIGNALSENGEVSGTAGLLLAISMLVAGIVGIATRKHLYGGFVSAGFYFAGALIGIANYGSYKDLAIWSALSFAFSLTFLIGGIFCVIQAKRSGPIQDSSPSQDSPSEPKE
ncbi:MAG: hypothetical protein IJR83_05415 [Clostridia bacterium]|nr:hypothetical protein [Clostridia bacterium]MBQ7153361.1 hypothetical protein [Clostridia bacterium]